MARRVMYSRRPFAELDEFGGFGATGQMVASSSESSGQRWLKIYRNKTVTPIVFEWEAMDESGVLKTGTAPTQVEAENAAFIAMRSLAVSQGQLPAWTIVPKPVPGAPTPAPVTPTQRNWWDDLIAAIKNFLGVR